MIMFPAENLSNHHHHLPHGGGGDGGCFYGYFGTSFAESSSFNGYEYHHNEACVGSDLGAAAANSMAEDESRTNSTVNEEGSSSKDVINNNQEQQEQDKDWLQLGLGGQATTTTTTTSYDQYDQNNKHVQGYLGSRRGGLMELDLLPGGSSKSQQARPLAPMFHMPEFRPPSRPTGMHSFSTLFFQQQQQQGSSSMIPPHHGEINWAIKPIPQHIAAGSSSSSLAPSWSYFGRPFQVQSMDVAGPSTEVIRIIDPPRRPHSGLWFMLQASHNQAKEPFLPQIPKSYLRIKDGKMTVRLLMKYVANKLRLDSESEIEIRCRGEQLEPLMTLQHVRDQIWSSRQALALLPADYTSTTTTSDINNNSNNNNNNNNNSNSNNSNNNVMVLHYGRIS